MNHTLAVVASLISILLLWAGFFWLYRDYAVDSFRQQMFALRDQMFDEAQSRKIIVFDDVPYGIIRTMMNGSIRFAHMLSFLHFVIAIRQAKRGSENASFVSSFRRSLAELEPQKQDAYAGFLRRFHRLVLRQILLGSPIVVVTVVLPFLCWIFFDWVLSMIGGKALDTFDTLTFAAGDDSEAQQTT